MLERLRDLPNGVTGLRASGRVSKEDYDKVLVPMLEEARAAGARVRLLYHFSTDFERFTPSGAWEDTLVGLQYLRLFERCAVVSEREWLRAATRAVGGLMPCPVRAFRESEWTEALTWLRATTETARMAHRLLPDRGVLVIEPSGKLRREDFDAVAMTVDPWIEANGELDGVVVHVRSFPGWENVGSFIRHMQFIRDYQHRIRRVAVAAESRFAEIGPALAEHFISAEIKGFGYDELDRAIEWAGRARGAEPIAAP